VPREMIDNVSKKVVYDPAEMVMTNRLFKEGLYAVLRGEPYFDPSFTVRTRDAINYARGRHFGLFLKWYGWVGVNLYNRGDGSLTSQARGLWEMALKESFLI